MKKRNIFILIICILLSLLLIRTAYFNCNKLNAEITNYEISSVIDDFYVDFFPVSIIERKKINESDYCLINIYLDIYNDKENSYNRWKCFLKSNNKRFKVWIDNFIPESYADYIETETVYKGDAHWLLVYKGDSTIEQVKSFIEDEIEVYVVGRIVK